MILKNGKVQKIIKIKAAGGIFEISNRDLFEQDTQNQNSICNFIQNLNKINSPSWATFGKLQILFFLFFLITIFFLAFNETEKYQQLIMYLSLIPFLLNLVIFIVRILIWIHKVKQILREYKFKFQDQYIIQQQDLMINALLGNKTYPDLVIFTIHEKSSDFFIQKENPFSDISDEENDQIESLTNLEPLLRKQKPMKKNRTRSDLNFNQKIFCNNF